jgi:arsenate reductase
MKKAFNWLDTHDVAYEFVDYKKASVAATHLPDWNRRAGWKTLLNTRGLMWRKLSEEQRTDVDETKALALMAEYPSLIKRPVTDTGKSLLIGFDIDRYNAEFATK